MNEFEQESHKRASRERAFDVNEATNMNENCFSPIISHLIWLNIC